MTSAQILTASDDDLRQAAGWLAQGGLVAIPTETVYGLAADACNPEAVAQVFEVKGRPAFDPLIVHVSSARATVDALEAAGVCAPRQMSAPARALASRLAASFWPGPLTIVFPRGERIPELVTSGRPTVAVRVPAHPVALALLERSGLALAAPSANRFGRTSPTRVEHVRAELGGRIRFILDGGPAPVGVESTIVAPDPEGGLVLLRPGGISLEALEAETGVRPRAPDRGTGVLAPGMLEAHYAPSKRLTLIRLEPPTDPQTRAMLERALGSAGVVGLIRTAGPAEVPRWLRDLGPGVSWRAVTLSAGGDGREAARNLFAILRDLDASDAELLFAEEPTGTGGLWPAIQDRLSRAGARP